MDLKLLIKIPVLNLKDEMVKPMASKFTRNLDSIIKGEILCWGCGEFGQHGHRNTTNIGPEEPLMPSLNERLDSGQTQRADGGTSLSTGSFMWRLRVFDCGASHTVVVTEKDEVYAWGNGNSGQLGCGDKKTHLTPQRIRLPLENQSSPVRGLACGSRHTVLWLENGLCFSWGNNFYAQLGYDFRVENYKDNQMACEFLLHHLARKMSEVFPHLLRPIAHMKVNQVACGEKHTLFLYNTGTVAGCGCNNFGQLGTGSRAEVVSPKSLDSLEGVVFIACGANHSMAVTVDGELFTWGLGRACGYRREDKLFPVRKMTRRSNIVASAGGSSHSLALTANGTLYTWGGGTEGQLGHGSDVLYLCKPKPLSHDALPRASQIACGDTYSAAVTSDGILYMWGQNNHVITASSNSDPSHKHFVPTLVSPGGNRVASIACGSWHAMAVTGSPDWQPLEEDSEEEMDDGSIISSANGTQLESGQAHAGVGSVSPEVFLKEAVRQEMTKPTYHSVQRETTKLTLAEFYAPTPIPTTIAMEDLGTEMDLDQDGGKEEEESSPESGKKPYRIEERLESDPEEEQKLSDEMKSVETANNVLEDESPVHSALTSSAGETYATPAAKNKSRKDELAADVTKTGKEKTQRHDDKQNYSKELKIVRSKTMPVVNRKPLKMTPASTISGTDWSELSKLSASSMPEKDKFVIQKHVSVQSSRRGNGSGDKAVKRNLVTHVGFHSSGEGDRPLVQSAANQMTLPQLPKFNRAKTYYGQMKQQKRDPEPKMSQFLYTLPPAPSSQTFSNQQSHQRALLKKPSGAAELSPNHTQPILDRTHAIPELRNRQPGKSVFSAASWRTRNKDSAI